MKIERKCLWCGKIFYVKLSIVKRGEGKFCSRKCAHAALALATKMSGRFKGSNNPRWKGGRIKRLCLVCGKEFYVDPSDIKRRKGNFCSIECRGKWQSQNIVRERVPTYKGGRKLNGDGYVQILIGTNQYEFEHRLVWEKANGKIPKGYIIHHLNGLKTDNRLENLICISRTMHSPRKIVEPYQERIRQLELDLQRNKFGGSKELKEE